METKIGGPSVTPSTNGAKEETEKDYLHGLFEKLFRNHRSKRSWDWYGGGAKQSSREENFGGEKFGGSKLSGLNPGFRGLQKTRGKKEAPPNPLV